MNLVEALQLYISLQEGLWKGFVCDILAGETIETFKFDQRSGVLEFEGVWEYSVHGVGVRFIQGKYGIDYHDTAKPVDSFNSWAIAFFLGRLGRQGQKICKKVGFSEGPVEPQLKAFFRKGVDAGIFELVDETQDSYRFR